MGLHRHISCIIGLAFLPVANLVAQQVPDLNFDPTIEYPAYPTGKGPVIFIDEGHNNFHTKDGRYLPFAKVLEKDGCVVMPYKGLFDEKSLSDGKILVIANALNEINVDNWTLPTPSAFSVEEIETGKRWSIISDSRSHAVAWCGRRPGLRVWVYPSSTVLISM